ncbi:MAG TPA: acyltransferase family protein [Methanoregula sp.]|nr:acyltransferase family protein [Methanoregula sp.]
MSGAGAEKMSGGRLLFIDNLRILLICLVIATHCSITYGGPGSWYFTDPGNGPGNPFVLILLNGLDQAFFMGFFILVSAYFLPGSLSRKGPARFARDRLVRLGIPLAVWILLIAPFIAYILAAGTGNTPASVFGFWVSYFVPFQGLHLGPMWFVFFLLVATFAYLAWNAFRPPAPPGGAELRPFPAFPSILALGLLLGLVTAGVRVFLPIGYTWLFTLQPPFFAQYIAAFVIGIYAAHNHWLDDVPARTGKLCAAAAVILVVAEPVLLSVILSSPGGLGAAMGGVHWQALLLALWEQTACVMIVTGLLWIFSARFNRQGPVTEAMAADTYTVYIIHPVVLILLALAFAGITIPSLAKFAIVLPLAIASSFLLAHLIRAVPGVKRVL